MTKGHDFPHHGDTGDHSVDQDNFECRSVADRAALRYGAEYRENGPHLREILARQHDQLPGGSSVRTAHDRRVDQRDAAGQEGGYLLS